MKNIIETISRLWWIKVRGELTNPRSEKSIQALEEVLVEDLEFEDVVVEYVVEAIKGEPKEPEEEKEEPEEKEDETPDEEKDGDKDAAIKNIKYGSLTQLEKDKLKEQSITEKEYVDNAKNRKLNRVGKEWGASGKETSDDGKEIDDKKPSDEEEPKAEEEGDDVVLAKEDSQKVLKQILMTKEEAKKQQKGVGLGTAESRTGESVTVYAGQKIQELMKQKKSYEEAREIVQNELMEIAKDKKNVLTSSWVKSGMSAFDYLNEVYGFDKIEHFAWDTPQGNELVGSTGHGTSADMFVQTKDGKTIGVSLKKDFKVFIVNGGYKKAMKEFEEKAGVKLPENCQADHYNKRRKTQFSKAKEIISKDRAFFESQAKIVLENEEEFNKTFGPKEDSIRSRKLYITAKKLGISFAKAKTMSDEEINNTLKNTTPQEFVSIMEEIKTGDDMKAAAGFFKRDEIESKHGIYGNLRKLDNEMTENIFNAFQSNEDMRNKTKEKIIEDTHIVDTLFPEEPLDDFKTVFGTDPAVEMSRKSIQNIFGIGDLYEKYKNVESDEEKQKLKEQIQKNIKDKLKITKKRGVPIIAIVVENEDGTSSDLPLYKIGVRARGIGNAQALEVSQAVFGSLALKNGNTDIKTWGDKDRETVVDGETTDILSIFEDDKNPDLSELSSAEIKDLKERIKQLESYNSKSKKLKDLKSKLDM